MLFGGSMQRTKKNHGFTLIELMVTIAIIAIVAMIAAPNLQSSIDKQTIERTTSDFEKNLAQARADAVFYRKKTTIHINVTGTDTATDRYWAIPANTNILFKTAVCSGSVWSTTPITPLSSIVFLPQGNVESLPANIEIQIKNEKAERFIYLTNFGRITASLKSAFEGDCE